MYYDTFIAIHSPRYIHYNAFLRRLFPCRFVVGVCSARCSFLDSSDSSFRLDSCLLTGLSPLSLLFYDGIAACVLWVALLLLRCRCLVASVCHQICLKKFCSPHLLLSVCSVVDCWFLWLFEQVICTSKPAAIVSQLC